MRKGIVRHGPEAHQQRQFRIQASQSGVHAASVLALTCNFTPAEGMATLVNRYQVRYLFSLLFLRLYRSLSFPNTHFPNHRESVTLLPLFSPVEPVVTH